MFLSVLIPVYNAEEYLDRCINSILSQTENDFEIILVDDGSSDNSLSKCNEWHIKFPDKIKVISKENSGSLETRRVCLSNSVGDYLYFVDADDYIIDDDAFATIKDAIQQTKCDLIIFNATVDGIKKNKLYSYPFNDGKVFENDSLNEVYEVLLRGTQLNTLWNKVFSRNLVDWKADYSVLKEIIKGTDFYQILPIISNAQKIMYLDKVYYLYNVQNNGSISHKFKPLLYKTTCIQHQRLVKFSEKWVINADKDLLLKQRFTADVAQIIMMMNYVEDLSIHEKIMFFKKIRNDDMYLSNHSRQGLKITRRVAIRLLDIKAFHILLFYIKIIGLYKYAREKHFNRSHKEK